MSRPGALAEGVGLGLLVVAGQVLLLAGLAWLTVAPLSFAGALPPGAPPGRPVVSLHVGPVLLAGGALAARVARDVPLPLAALRGADIEIYEIDDDVPSDVIRVPPGTGWVPVVRARDDEDLVGIFARVEGRRIRALEVIAGDGDNLVRVHVTGRVEQALRALLRWGLAEGWDGPLVRVTNGSSRPGPPAP